MANGVKYARNFLYCGVALAAIASIGLAFATNSVRKYIYVAVGLSGAGISILAAKKLHSATLLIQNLINAGGGIN